MKRLGIVITSFNDLRIGEAIASVRRFDDVGTVKLVVVDGGSRPDVVALIQSLLAPDDIFVSERDGGIFDGLNKGLALCDTEYLGWLGSDDLFTGQVTAGEVVAALADNDLFIGSAAFFLDDRVRRMTLGWPTKLGLARFGLHNPHYATFGRTALLASRRFRLDVLGADIDYFHQILVQKPRIAVTRKVATLMREGGFSNSSRKRILQVNLQLLPVYAEQDGWLLAPFALAIKLGYKFSSRLYFKLFACTRAQLERRPTPRLQAD